MVFRLINAKAIEDAVYEFPDVGIVQFKGPNSNGKSILLHVVSDILKMDIETQEARDPLIRDNEEELELHAEYKGKRLLVFINRDRDKCKLVYQRSDDDDMIVRFLREGGWREIFDEFGFIIYKDSFVLQIFETFGKMPFVNTSPKETGDIVDIMTQDAVAEQFLKNYKEVTHPKFTSTFKAAKESVSKIEMQLAGLTDIDYLSFEELHNRLEKIYPYVRHLTPMHLEELRMPPIVKIWPIPQIKLPYIEFPVIAPTMESLSDLTGQIRQYADILAGVCPTCGKSLVGVHELHLEVPADAV